MDSKISSLPVWPSYSKEEIKKVENVLASGKVNYWTGNECKNFESEFSDWSNSRYSIALSNGTVALDIALRSLGLKKNDEVIVTPRSFIASVSSVVGIGAKPVFADIDLLTGNLTAATIEPKISKKTKAIICVHLGGLPCEMDQIMSLARKYGIFVIEDCAQAHGARYRGKSVGTIGDIGAWSFCQDKIMSTGGEGGMVTSNNKELWKKMWSYKDHGKDYDAIQSSDNSVGFKWIHKSFGSNFRMTEMQGAIGRVQLKKMNEWNQLRQENAQIIIDNLKNFPDIVNLPQTPNYINHGHYRVYASLKTENLKTSWSRDMIIDEITQLGVPCFVGSCPEIYREEAFKNSGFVPVKRLPNAKKLGETSLAFLCHPTLRKKDLERFNKVISKVLGHAAK